MLIKNYYHFMKNLSRIIIIVGLFTLNIAQVSAQFTILPLADKEADCDTLLNLFEVSQEIPSTHSVNVNQAATASSNAKKTYEDAQKEADSFGEQRVNGIDTIATVCGSEAWLAGPGTCTKYGELVSAAKDAERSASEAASAYDDAARTIVINEPSERDNLLGCAIKTGRISLNMLPYFVTYIANFLLSLAGIISVLFIVIGGYQYIYGGLIDQKEKGKKTILNAVAGLAVALLSWVVVQIIITAITS